MAMAVGRPVNMMKIAAQQLFFLPSKAWAIKMAMAVGRPVNMMKIAAQRLFFIAERSAGNQNGYGRRPASKYYEK